jgi:cyclopropane fatty-acyl-phospholipid synthase-like methyltransferase
MMTKQQEFDSYYENKQTEIKWFEPYIQPKMLDEWNNQSIKVGDYLLDVGGGCSFDGIFYATNGVHTTVLDYSQNALRKLNELALLIGVSLKLVNSSILDVSEELHGVFDIITDNGCFHHIGPEDRPLYINSVSRLLKSGGFLYIRAMSEYVPPSSDNFLRAYRISSDDITQKDFMDNFKIVEMSLFDYVLNARGQQKMWFIKLQKR